MLGHSHRQKPSDLVDPWRKEWESFCGTLNCKITDAGVLLYRHIARKIIDKFLNFDLNQKLDIRSVADHENSKSFLHGIFSSRRLYQGFLLHILSDANAGCISMHLHSDRILTFCTRMSFIITWKKGPWTYTSLRLLLAARVLNSLPFSHVNDTQSSTSC
jgi:hypothetical protein